MCYKGKCLYCIKVETGTLIFAIINAILSSLSLLACIVILVIFNTGLYTAMPNENTWERLADGGSRDFFRETVGALGNGIIVTITLIVTLNFIFAVLLADGICKKIPGKIRAYFIYGVIINVLLYITSIAMISTMHILTAPAFFMMVSCIIYTAILVMIRMTQEKLTSGVIYYNAQVHPPPFQPLV